MANAENKEGVWEDHQSGADQTRLHKLTAKAEEEYNLQVDKYREKLCRLKRNLDYEMDMYKTEEDYTPESLRVYKNRIENSLKNYASVTQEAAQYLQRKCTEESLKEFEFHRLAWETLRKPVDSILCEIDEKEQALLEQKSTRSSARSNATSDTAKMRAKAEAANAALQFAAKEAELKKAEAEMALKKANIQTDLELLNKHREAAVATAEYHAVIEEMESRGIGSEHSIHLPKEKSIERTRRYVESTNFVVQQPVNETCPAPSLHSVKTNVEAEIHEEQQNTVRPELSELSRFLLKRDLLMSRFSKFNDKPELYELWKTSFQAIAKELAVSSLEESELLVKYLGPESSKFAQSIRAANINNPSAGLHKIWKRLQERYGSAETVEMSIKAKLNDFKGITYKDCKRLYDLQDILCEIESLKANDTYEKLFSYYDTSLGINPIVSKLPTALQTKWRDKATSYKRTNGVAFPPFSFFANFVAEQATTLNDPGFVYNPPQDRNNVSQQTVKSNQRPRVTASKTDIVKNQPMKCPIHKSNHSLNDCRKFKSKPIEDRRKIVDDNGICFKCLESQDHRSRNCPKTIQCQECRSSYHSTGMHVTDPHKLENSNSHGGERNPEIDTLAKTYCIEVCNGGFRGKSCAKIVQVYISHPDNSDRPLKAYVMLDEQSNRTLGRKKLFDMFNISCGLEQYTMMSCSGQTTMSGRRATGLTIESLDGSYKVDLPTIIECDQIPNNREEIPTPEIASYHEHLQGIASELEPVNTEADILLLIGRDLPDVHHIIEQRTGPPNSPYAQKTKLGWVIVGDVCLDRRHCPDSVNAFKTYICADGRPSLFKPCPNVLSIRETLATKNKLDNFDCDTIKLGNGVFDRTENDDMTGKSVEDKIFLETMEKEFHKDGDGNWCAPLPFKPKRERLPNNFPMALHRARTLDRSLESNESKRKHFLEFMQALIENKHAEIAPKLDQTAESWYLPVFGVYHPRKPGKIRCVFDSSAKFDGISLNKVLLQGPDLNNSLLGVLLRFRKNRVAASADIQQMFYSFRVEEEHREFLRFLWHKDNDLTKQLISYRMTVHVFGNSPSPSVAIYGLRKCAEDADPDVKDFILRHFYVDDGLVSVDTSDEMTSLLRRTQTTLRKAGNIRLHKFASNSEEVMSELPQDDLAQDLKDLDLDSDSFPLQRSLGLYWDLGSDCFTFRIADESKPFTRRGVLSTLNSVYDPLGFVAPVLIQGKWLLRDLTMQAVGWDEPLPEQKRKEWETWRNSLNALEQFKVPRMYGSTSLNKASSLELHVFADASEKAIGAVSYLKIIQDNDNCDIGFIFGKAKVAPQHGHTIPRLELCAAVLAVEVAEAVVQNLDMEFDAIKLYSDSKVVLGYIHNQTRRFFVYVENRVQRILRSTLQEQWNYVPTSVNPADQATRSVSAEDIGMSSWIHGPTEFLRNQTQVSDFKEADVSLVEPELDKEIRPLLSVMKTQVVDQSLLGQDRFQRFSKWNTLVRAVALLRRFIISRKEKVPMNSLDVVTSLNETETFLIKQVQRETYRREIECIKNGQNVSRNSDIISLDPFLDQDDTLRVGGRLNKSDWLPHKEKNPLLLPGKSYLAKLVVEHFHSQVKHQGRHFTEGAVRSAGFWITGLKRLVSSVIHRCVVCRRLRGLMEVQKMADLPADRIQPAPPFTNVGVDAFGPWSIVHRRTRGGSANSKRWAILFTCLTTRAIHIEVVEEMSSNAFINAMCRFIAIRGKVDIFRSDRGTNFVGATDSLNIEAINIEDGTMKNFLRDSRTKWLFNPPHSSHMGGAWERLIGVTRRILDSMLLESKLKHLTHDVLVTFMAEVTSIVNHRPLVPVSTDSDSPFVLSPAVLLTQKMSSSASTDYIGDLDTKDLLRAEWKRVMCLSNMFWSRWRKEYLNSLQSRRKWRTDNPNIKEGDVVLLRDKTVHRNEWPLGLIVRTFESDDGKVRKTEVRVTKDGKPTVYVRPITELVLLVSR